MQRLEEYPPTKRPGGARNIIRNLFLDFSLDKHTSHCSHHVTESPGSDVPRVPVVEVTSLQDGTLYCRKSTHTACWSVRQPVKASGCGHYTTTISILSEVRLPDSGPQRTMGPGEDTVYWLYHSGTKNNFGLHSFPIALSKGTNEVWITWVPISSRLVVARFKRSPRTKQWSFMRQPSRLTHYKIWLVPKGDLVFVAGGWNARTSHSDESTRPLLGWLELSQRCETGSWQVNFPGMNGLLVCNTIPK